MSHAQSDPPESAQSQVQIQMSIDRVERLRAELTCLPGRLLSDQKVSQYQVQMLHLLDSSGAAAMGRDHPRAHFTASAFICSAQGEVLALFHRKLQRWLQPGGHMELSDQSAFEAALREAREESGLDDLQALSQSPIDLDIHIIPARGQELEHAHYDIRYAFVAADPTSARRSEESTGLRWLSHRQLSEWCASAPSIDRPVRMMLELLNDDEIARPEHEPAL